MRHIISFVLIVCLLHTQSYHAAADTMYVQQMPLEEGASDYSMQQTIMGLNQLESGGITSEVKTKISPFELVASLKQNVHVLKESVSAFMDTLPGFLTVFFTGIVLFGSSIFLFAFGFVAWWDDIPLPVVFAELTHASLPHFQPLDVCQNFLADPKDLERTRSFSHYAHASGANGLTYTEALPQWINNANNILMIISDLILGERSSDGQYIQRSYEFEQQFKKLLYVNAGNMKNNYSCAFKLGNSSDHDVITECQEDFQPDIYYSVAQIPDNADALIQFRRWNKKKIIISPESIRVRLSVKPKRYPRLDYTQKLAHSDDLDHMFMQRRLLQSSNSLTLSDAVQDRISNNLDVMAQLNGELNRRRVLESINQTAISESLTSVGLVFKTNHIALTSDVGCNVSSTNGIFKLVSCFEGVASDIPAASPAADKEQVWFVRNRENSLSQVKIIAYTLPLEAFIAPWLKQSTQVMDNLWRVANTLRQRECNTTSDEHLDQLMAAAQHELANHGAYLQGDIGCDIQFNEMGAEMIQCQNETAPEIKGCDLEFNVAVCKNAKLWFSSNVWSAGEIGSVAVSIHPFWQGSVSKTLPQSESNDINDISKSLILTDSHRASNSVDHEVTSSIPESISRETSHSSMLSDSNELSHEATLSESEATLSESEKSSKSLTAEMSDSSSSILPSRSNTLSQQNVTNDGTIELYYQLNRNLIKKTFNATSCVNETTIATLSIEPNYAAYNPANKTLYLMDYTNGCCNANELLILKRGIISGNQVTLAAQPACTFQNLGNGISAFYVSPNTNDLFMVRGSGGTGAKIYWAPYNHQSNTCTQTETQIQNGFGGNYAFDLYYNSLSQKLLVLYGLSYIVAWDFNATAPTAQLKNPFSVYNRSTAEGETIEGMVYNEKSKELYIQLQYNSSVGVLKKAFFDFQNPMYLTDIRELQRFTATYVGEIIGIGN